MTKLKEVRCAKKLKASDLARLMNVSRAAICLAERIGIKHADTAVRYAKVLKCRPEDLIEFNTGEE